LVSDAGTPGVSDPGNKLIEEVLKRLPETEIITIPGPSTLAALLSISGIPTDRFLFLGFLPAKKKRQAILKKIVESEYPVVFFESPYKILKTLKELAELKADLKAIVAKELTKMFEKVYRGRIKEVIQQVGEDGARGEYAVIIQK